MILQSASAIITFLFLVIILSYYVLLFIRRRRPKTHKRLNSISIIIPAHNEAPYLKATIDAVLQADFVGEKQVIVVDDASKDATARIARSCKKVRLIRNVAQLGKAASINRALKQATGDIIAIVDADSVIRKNALEEMAKELSRDGVGGATGVVLVKNRNELINMWVHIEQLYNSLMRLIMSKVNANIVTPGPLSMYKRSALKKLGGFSTDGFSEDINVSIRLIRAGYRIGYTHKAVSATNMPYRRKWFFKQRARFARGMLHVFKRHLSLKKTIIDLYTLPIYVFTYVQAVIMGLFTLYQIVAGYITYFASQGTFLNLAVAKFFLEWFSIVGFVRWVGSVIAGTTPLTFITIIGIISTLLTYPLYCFAIAKFDKRIDWRHLIPLVFMAPFWWLIMVIYIAMLPELFRKQQYNKWQKNEP
ncbi:glycosyltransferase family 2 protein [Candidatus Woesearchaeota archaeon]|nr:glycosyltransferase family 2 protein [Candidatus Woesearchaeota archaeon]